MAMNQQQINDDEQAYAAAFDEDMAPAAEPSEDEAFGIKPPVEDAPAASDGGTEGEAPAVALVIAEDEPEPAAEQATEPTPEPADEGPTDPKEIQRQKSWEGRLRAREEELARREAALKASQGQAKEEPTEGLESAAERLEDAGEPEKAKAVEQAADAIENGDMTAEQAMKVLADDFGPEFVRMIEAIAASKAEAAGRTVAERAAGELGQSVQSIIDNIVDDRERRHFEAIADAHPDFAEISDNPEFAEFAKSYQDGERIATEGSAREINKMLSDFKKSRQQEPQKPDPAVEAAEGVRSSGLRLPTAPTQADGYEEAWKDF